MQPKLILIVLPNKGSFFFNYKTFLFFRTLKSWFEQAFAILYWYLSRTKKAQLWVCYQKKIFILNVFSLDYFFSATPSSLDNYYTIIEDPSQKLALLVDFVKKAQKCIVFFSTCACVEYFSVCLERLLKDRKIFSIHGKKGQKRHKVFDAFKQTKQGLLLCTGKT